MGRFLSVSSCVRIARFHIPCVKTRTITRRCVRYLIFQIRPDADANGSNVSVCHFQDKENAETTLRGKCVQLIRSRATATSNKFLHHGRATNYLARRALTVRFATIRRRLVGLYRLFNHERGSYVAKRPARTNDDLIVRVSTCVLTARRIVKYHKRSFHFNRLHRERGRDALRSRQNVRLANGMRVRQRLHRLLRCLLRRRRTGITMGVAFTVRLTLNCPLGSEVLRALIRPRTVYRIRNVSQYVLIKRRPFPRLGVKAVVTVLTCLHAVPLIRPALKMQTICQVQICSIRMRTSVKEGPQFIRRGFTSNGIPLITVTRRKRVDKGLIVRFCLTLVVRFRSNGRHDHDLNRQDRVGGIQEASDDNVLVEINSRTFIVCQRSIFPRRRTTAEVDSHFRSLSNGNVSALRRVQLRTMVFQGDLPQFRTQLGRATHSH